MMEPAKIEVGSRVRTDLGDINELAGSIARVGQIHPIRVSINGKAGDKPKLVAGYRRLMACKQLGQEVRVEIVGVQDEYSELLRQIQPRGERMPAHRARGRKGSAAAAAG
jgi:ParB family chromosome partitioning protein